MPEFKRDCHRRAFALLEAMNAEFLRSTHCYFGGGTRLAMELGEYRMNVRGLSEGIRGRSTHIGRWLGVGAPRRTCKKLSRGLVSVTLKSSGTILNVAHSVRTLHLFQRSSLGLPDAGGRGRGTDLPIGRMPTLRPGAA